MAMKRQRIYKDPYSEKELLVLIHNYEELNDLRSKAWIQVRLMDLDRAFAALRPKEKAAVLLIGFVGMTIRDAEKLIGVDNSTMIRRYYRGLDYMASYLNGGT